MRKGREIKGLWVFAEEYRFSQLCQEPQKGNPEQGPGTDRSSLKLKCLGRVEDLVFHCFGTIEGFLVSTNGIWKTVRFLPVTEIIHMEQDFFCVRGAQSLRKIRRDMAARGCKNWIGAKVFTAEGEDFGTVTDVILSPNCSFLTGLEISQGVVADLEFGRKFLPWGEIITVEEQTVLTNKEEPVSEQ